IRRATLVLTHARRHDAIRSAHSDLALQHDAVSTAHDQMKQECERLRAVLVGLDEGICVLDKSGAILSVNAVGCALLGWPQERELGERIGDLLHDAADDLAFLKSASQLVQTLASTTALRRDRALFRKANGDAVAVSCVIAPLVMREEISGA